MRVMATQWAFLYNGKSFKAGQIFQGFTLASLQTSDTKPPLYCFTALTTKHRRSGIFSPSLHKFCTSSSMLIRVWGPQRGCGIFSLWQELCALKTLKKIIGIIGYLGKPRSGSRCRQILQQAELYSHSPQDAELRTKHPDILQEILPSLRKNLQESKEPPSCSSECLSLLDMLHLSPCLPLMLWAPQGVVVIVPVPCSSPLESGRCSRCWDEEKHAHAPKSCTSQGSVKSWREQKQE